MPPFFLEVSKNCLALNNSIFFGSPRVYLTSVFSGLCGLLCLYLSVSTDECPPPPTSGVLSPGEQIQHPQNPASVHPPPPMDAETQHGFQGREFLREHW